MTKKGPSLRTKARGQANQIQGFIIIAAWSLLSLVVLSILRPIWFANPLVTIDPYIYWTSPTAFEYAKENFSDTYYFRRWTLQLTVLFFQFLIPDVVAALRTQASLELWLVLILAGLLVKRLSGNTNMSLALISVVGTVPFFTRQIGGTYHQGPGLIFGMLAIYLVGIAFTLPGRARTALLILGGSALGFCFITYPALVMLAPMLILACGFRGKVGKSPISEEALNLRLWKDGIKIAAGAIFVVGPLDATVVGFLGGPRTNVLLQSAKIADANHASRAFGQSGAEFLSWLITGENAHWFWLSLCLMLLGLTSYGLNTRLSSVFLSMGLTTFIYLLRTDLGAAPFKWSHIVIHLALFSMIVAFVILGRLWDSRQTRFLPFLLCVAGFVGLLAPNLGFALPAKAWGLGFVTMFLVAFSSGWSWVLRRFAIRFQSLIVTSVVFGPFAVGLAAITTQVESPEGANSESTLYKIREEVDQVLSYGLSRGSRIWILDTRDWPGWSPVISSAYGLYSALSVKSQPESFDCAQVDWIGSKDNSEIVVIAENLGDRAALSRVTKLWSFCDSELSFRIGDSWENGSTRFIPLKLETKE